LSGATQQEELQQYNHQEQIGGILQECTITLILLRFARLFLHLFARFQAARPGTRKNQQLCELSQVFYYLLESP
jgi:hypothetical protein